ncbi:MAG: GNAT family N-acetyltransferase [Deltaproteobacteria bacterium]|jgi:ribosomal-protein-alanine N-acetyltransferase|nr:GNAT family N-acetyltransferase [Deltaproteobacteria bacterium]
MRCDDPPLVPDVPVRLVPIARADAAEWFAYLSQPRAVEHTSWDLSGGVDALEKLIDGYESVDPSSAIRFAVRSREGDHLVGTIGFHSISLVHRTAELAYDVAPAYAGRGVASACVCAIVPWGFAARGYERIQATVVDTNAASIRVLEKTGFAREGLLRGYRRVRGAPRDLWMYARLAP